MNKARRKLKKRIILMRNKFPHSNTERKYVKMKNDGKIWAVIGGVAALGAAAVAATIHFRKKQLVCADEDFCCDVSSEKIEPAEQAMEPVVEMAAVEDSPCVAEENETVSELTDKAQTATLEAANKGVMQKKQLQGRLEIEISAVDGVKSCTVIISDAPDGNKSLVTVTLRMKEKQEITDKEQAAIKALVKNSMGDILEDDITIDFAE